MRTRTNIARALLRLGAFIQSLPVVIMRTGDLIEFGRQTYSKEEDVESWSNQEFLDSGLGPDELDLLRDLDVKAGSLLLLGVGGGRDAVPLAKMGFRVTGLDYVPEMVKRAIANAYARGVEITGLVQEISNLDLPTNYYDVVWISRSMYSCVPTRKRRVTMVSRINNALKPGGYFLCQFHHDPRSHLSNKGMLIRRFIAILSFGNIGFENGDTLYGNVEFLHAFDSIDEVRSEIEEGGLRVIRFQTEINPMRCGAICRKFVK